MESPTQTPFLTRPTYEIGTRKTILIIEDNPVIRELLIFTFTLSGYQVVAVEQLSSFTWNTNNAQMFPDGIVLDIDIRSTVFKGPSDILHTFCTRWQCAFMSTKIPPLLLITTQPEDQRRFEKEGYLVVTKPFKPPALLVHMNKLWSKNAKNSFESGR